MVTRWLPESKNDEIYSVKSIWPTVRDRGVGGSNPLAPTNFYLRNWRAQSGRPLGSASFTEWPAAQIPPSATLHTQIVRDLPHCRR